MVLADLRKREARDGLERHAHFASSPALCDAELCLTVEEATQKFRLWKPRGRSRRMLPNLSLAKLHAGPVYEEIHICFVSPPSKKAQFDNQGFPVALVLAGYGTQRVPNPYTERTIYMDHIEIEVGSPSETTAASAGMLHQPEQGAGDQNQAVEMESTANEGVAVITDQPKNDAVTGKRRHGLSQEHKAKLLAGRQAYLAKKHAAKVGSAGADAPNPAADTPRQSRTLLRL